MELVNTTNEIWLIGSGPSGALAEPANSTPVACVNGSFQLITPRKPDVYLLAEIAAAEKYGGKLLEFRDAEKDVYARPVASQVIQREHGPTHNVAVVGKGFGPHELRPLHENRPLPRRPLGHRPTSPWISSGVLMLWILAELYRPARIVVAGLDGYPPDPSPPVEPTRVQGDKPVPGEYAPGVDALPSRPVRTAEWCEIQNKRMSGAVKAITNHYTDTVFEWLTRPAFWNDAWRATVRE